MANDTKTKSGRREAREAVFTLLFETEYHDGEAPETILARAAEDREFDAADKYITATYLGVMQHLPELDALIGKYAKGWKTGRLSRVSRAVLRLGTYEMTFGGVPAPVAINEAVELFKKYDDPESKTKSFVNGVLNAVKDAVKDGFPADLMPAAEPAEESAEESAAETPADDE